MDAEAALGAITFSSKFRLIFLCLEEVDEGEAPLLALAEKARELTELRRRFSSMASREMALFERLDKKVVLVIVFRRHSGSVPEDFIDVVRSEEKAFHGVDELLRVCAVQIASDVTVMWNAQTV